jgi:hypothetical protein
MLLDIRNVDIVYLHGPHRPERRVHMDRMLENAGLVGTCHVGICDRGKHSGVFGMIDVVKRRLEGEDFKPFILMEDDCSATEWFGHTIEFPEDADAVYLGVSRYGLPPHVDQGILHIEYKSVPGYDDTVRLYNMLSLHAVLFRTRRWAENCLRGYEQMSLRPMPDYDIPPCRSMPLFNVYTPRKPLFYQDSRVGGWEAETKFILT